MKILTKKNSTKTPLTFLKVNRPQWELEFLKHSLHRNEYSGQFVNQMYDLAKKLKKIEEIVEWCCLKGSSSTKMSILFQLLMNDKKSNLALDVGLALICLTGHESNLVSILKKKIIFLFFS